MNGSPWTQPAGGSGGLEGRCLNGHPGPGPPLPRSCTCPSASTVPSSATFADRIPNILEIEMLPFKSDSLYRLHAGDREPNCPQSSLKLELSLSLARGSSDRVPPWSQCPFRRTLHPSPAQHQAASRQATPRRPRPDGRPHSGPHARCQVHGGALKGSRGRAHNPSLLSPWNVDNQTPICSLPPVNPPTPQIKPVRWLHLSDTSSDGETKAQGPAPLPHRSPAHGREISLYLQ